MLNQYKNYKKRSMVLLVIYMHVFINLPFNVMPVKSMGTADNTEILSASAVNESDYEWSDWSPWSEEEPVSDPNREYESRYDVVGYDLVVYITQEEASPYERNFRSYSVNESYAEFGLRTSYGEYNYKNYAKKSLLENAQVYGEGSYVSQGVEGYQRGEGKAYYLNDNNNVWFISNEVMGSEYRYRDYILIDKKPSASPTPASRSSSVKNDGSTPVQYTYLTPTPKNTPSPSPRKTPAPTIPITAYNPKRSLENSDNEYIYNTVDPGDSIVLPIDKLELIADVSDAAQAVSETVQSLSDEQKQSAGGIDKMTLFAEEAINRAAPIITDDTDITIDQSLISEHEEDIQNAKNAVDEVLLLNGIHTNRNIRQTIRIKSTQQSKAKIKIDKNLSFSDSTIDNVKIDTDFIGVTAYVDNNHEDIELEIDKQDINQVSVNFENNTVSTIEISFPVEEDVTFSAIVDENDNPVGGKYNPATNTIDAKISQSGVFSVKENIKDFNDIKYKAYEMQFAIKFLASKGIINGTSATDFSPNDTISRAEVAALIVRMLNILDPNENGGFSDVNPSNWYYGVAGSSKKNGIINGFADNTFRGDTGIPKDQILVIAARVLKNEMYYVSPSNSSAYLPYADTDDIESWAKNDIALATMANLVIKRTDDKLHANDEISRGDASIIIFRLYQKIW